MMRNLTVICWSSEPNHCNRHSVVSRKHRCISSLPMVYTPTSQCLHSTCKTSQHAHHKTSFNSADNWRNSQQSKITTIITITITHSWFQNWKSVGTLMFHYQPANVAEAHESADGDAGSVCRNESRNAAALRLRWACSCLSRLASTSFSRAAIANLSARRSAAIQLPNIRRWCR